MLFLAMTSQKDIAHISFVSHLAYLGLLFNETYMLWLFQRYYRNNLDVIRDKELQNFANELSANGRGPNGGIGMVSQIYII